jgi:hypothetical protein
MAKNKGRCIGYQKIAIFGKTVLSRAPSYSMFTFLIKDCNTSFSSERLEIDYKESNHRAEVLYQLLSLRKFSCFSEIEDLGDYMPDIRGDYARTRFIVLQACRVILSLFHKYCKGTPNRGGSDVLQSYPTCFLITNQIKEGMK